MRRLRWLLLLLLALGLRAQPVPPAPERWVTDGAGFLSEDVRRDLDAELEAYERQTGHQVIVWIGRSTGGEPIEPFAARAFKAWGIGRKGKNDGAALFVMADDRKLRIEVGYDLEDRLPDALAGRIIRETISPRLQSGDRDGGVRAGADALLAAIEGKPFQGRAPPRQRAAEPEGCGVSPVVLILLLVFFGPLALRLLFGGFWGGGFGGGSWGGGGWSSGGGGGFSGGGGYSGGGGASGDW